VRKARHFAVSAHRRSDPAKIDREAPPNGAFERSWGPKTRDVESSLKKVSSLKIITSWLKCDSTFNP